MSKIDNWVNLRKLDNDFKNKIKLFYIFSPFEKDVMFVTNDDDVYAFGSESNSGEKPAIVEKLCNKQIVDIRDGSDYAIAMSETGLCYLWDKNYYKNGMHLIEPNLINELIEKKVIVISCGYDFTLVVTNEGQVYKFGIIESDWDLEFQFTPTLIDGFNNEKVITVSCGGWHSLALTDRGHVFSWGQNTNGQLGIGDNKSQIIPQLVDINGVIEIACGQRHSLCLTSYGFVYAFGYNYFGQIGCEIIDDPYNHKLSPLKVNTNNTKIISIASSFKTNISVAKTENGFCCFWGECAVGYVSHPKDTTLTSIDDVFALYAKNNITYKTIYIEENSVPLVDKHTHVFNNPEFSDFQFIINNEVIYVHKLILKINCNHFKTMFSQNWDQNDIKEKKIDLYSYQTYYAFLKYLYTNCVEIGIKDVIELYDLANIYFEEELKLKCIQIIKREITIENAFKLYSSVIKYNSEELHKIILKFMSLNLNDICCTQGFLETDPIVCKQLLEMMAKYRAFK